MAAEGTRTTSQSYTELIHFIRSAQKLVGSYLPTLREVLRPGLYLQDSKHSSELVDKTNFPYSAIARAFVPEVLGIWKRAKLNFRPHVVVSERTLLRTLESALRKASDIARKRVTSVNEVKEMTEKLDKLLDLARCKSSIMTCDQADCGGCDNDAH